MDSRQHLPERRLAEKTRRIGCEWATIDHLKPEESATPLRPSGTSNRAQWPRRGAGRGSGAWDGDTRAETADTGPSRGGAAAETDPLIRLLQ